MLYLFILITSIWAGADLYDDDRDFQGELTLSDSNQIPQVGERNPFFRALVGYSLNTTLKTYSIEELELKGVLWDNPKKTALFVTPAGKRYFLGLRDSIGAEDGVISEIRDGRVVIRLQDGTIIVKKVLRRNS